MQKSFIERIFPHTQGSFLPVHENISSQRSSATSPPRINLRDSSKRRSSRSSSDSHSLQPAPLSASVIHHEDPLLPIERATKSLQQSIQTFLDAQSASLDAGLNGRDEEDISSVGSPTPTPSITTPSRANSKPRVIPVRQPATKKITLRGARRGLSRSMAEFVQLKVEEVRVLEAESRLREDALRQTQQFEDKKESIKKQIESIKVKEDGTGASNLRDEARSLDQEIHDLETKLFEMRARHRHLINQAEQLESSMESKLSSYHSSLMMVEKEVKHFLSRPPITQGLLGNHATGLHIGMYKLKPERRSLQMAQEQWTAEINTLQQRKINAKEEQNALEEGALIWREAVKRINDFEKELKVQTRTLSDSQVRDMLTPDLTNGDTKMQHKEKSMQSVLNQLSAVIESLEADLTYAEARHWNLLICCIGAELEAFREAQRLLQYTSDVATSQLADDSGKDSTNLTRETTLESSIHSLKPLNINPLRSSSTDSNRSLEDTLKEFEGRNQVQTQKANLLETDMNQPQKPSLNQSAVRLNTQKSRESISESEDEDPGPDFFLSQA